MRVLVTGAMGFAGRHMAAELLAHGHEVIALDNRSADGEFPAEAEWMTVDVRHRERLRRAVAEAAPDGGIHLAALSFVPVVSAKPHIAFSVNVQGTLHLLEAWEKHAPDSPLVTVSSAEVYGLRDRGRPVRENDPTEPHTLYGVTKDAADKAALLFARAGRARTRKGNHGQPGQPPCPGGRARRGKSIQAAFNRGHPGRGL